MLGNRSLNNFASRIKSVFTIERVPPSRTPTQLRPTKVHPATAVSLGSHLTYSAKINSQQNRQPEKSVFQMPAILVQKGPSEKSQITETATPPKVRAGGPEPTSNGNEAERPEKNSEWLLTLQAFNNFMDKSGCEKQYLSAVYKQLDSKAELFDFDPKKNRSLKCALGRKINAIKTGNSGPSNTSIPGIPSAGTFAYDRAKKLFALRPSDPNGDEVLLRTREELELHLMIENHLIAVGQSSADPIVSLTALPEAKTRQRAESAPRWANGAGYFSAAKMTAGGSPLREAEEPVREPEPTRQDGLQRPFEEERQWHFFSNHDVDIARFETDLHASGGIVQRIGGENNNCWMRSAWLSSFIQCNDPEGLKQRLFFELGDRLTENMPPRPGLSNNRLPTIGEQIDIVHQAVLDLRNGRLKEENSSAGPFRKDVDDAIAVLSQALLMKDLTEDGIQGKVAENRKTSIRNATIGSGMGDSDQIRIIMRKLGTDMVLVSPNTPCIELDVARESALNEVGAQQRSIKLLQKKRLLPALRHVGIHFELYTRGNLWHTSA